MLAYDYIKKHEKEKAEEDKCLRTTLILLGKIQIGF